MTRADGSRRGSRPPERAARPATAWASRALLLLLLALPACSRAQSATPPAPRPGQQAAPAVPSAASPAPRVDTATLHRTLDSLAGAHRGVLGYTVLGLESGERLSLRGDETFPTASLIKVAVLVTLYDLFAKGRLAPDDRIVLTKIDQVPGSGILQHMTPGLTLTVHDAAWLMATMSDNTATNLVLDKIAIRRVWERMEALGLPHTKIHAKVFLGLSSVAPDSSAKYGLGVTTPNEMAQLFALLAQGKAVSPAADSAMLDIMAHSEEPQYVSRGTGGVRAARKTGSVNESRNECALFYLRQRVVACVLTKSNADKRWTLDAEPGLLMARMGEAIVRAYGTR